MRDNWNNGGLAVKTVPDEPFGEHLPNIIRCNRQSLIKLLVLRCWGLRGSAETIQQEDIAEKYAQRPDMQARCLAALCSPQICSLSTSTSLGDHYVNQTQTYNHIDTPQYTTYFIIHFIL